MNDGKRKNRTRAKGRVWAARNKYELNIEQALSKAVKVEREKAKER